MQKPNEDRTNFSIDELLSEKALNLLSTTPGDSFVLKPPVTRVKQCAAGSFAKTFVNEGICVTQPG